MSAPRFVPFGSFIDATFWNELNRLKLNEWRLDETPKLLKATISLHDSIGTECRFSLGHESFDPSTAGIPGLLYLMNTIESFKALNRKLFLHSRGAELWESIKNGEWMIDPSILWKFSLTMFADLKKFQYFYWNCSPGIVNFPLDLKQTTSPSEADLRQLEDYYNKTGELIFLSTQSGILPLRQLKTIGTNEFKVVIADPSPVNEVVGWPVRNALAALAFTLPELDRITVISLRLNGSLSEFMFNWKLTEAPDQPTFSGWESNSQGKLTPRFVDMRNQFDPVRLTEQAVALNLSLIKWRLAPEMQLERLQSLKVLIFGAGTLGCNIARNLLGYNVKTISFIDNSVVSFSNPVRQSLSKFEDAKESRGKTETAVNALKEIYPSVDAHGYNITVPMPGHSIDEKEHEKLEKDIELLEDLVEKHDVLFLALDSREARWLPTLLANKHKKMAYSVALGFDTFVVVRHGVNVNRQNDTPAYCEPGAIIPYSELACYFCSDVTAPGNSTADRTLDQQCTVSRPGLSPIAAGLAVELMSSVLQHKEPMEAPANIGEPDDSSSVFGATPHQIRGFVFKFQQMTPCVKRFDKCVGCGSAILEQFEQNGWKFVKEVMNSPALLEKITGLDIIQTSVNDIDIDFSDSDSVVSL